MGVQYIITPTEPPRWTFEGEDFLRRVRERWPGARTGINSNPNNPMPSEAFVFFDNPRHELIQSRACHLAPGRHVRVVPVGVTESLLVDADGRAWSFLADLRRDGVRVAIDDYGTGYASLSYLRQPAIDIVKIDKSYLTDLSQHRNRTLLTAIISLATQLGLEQIAEGVHNHASEQFLRSAHCRCGQGFYYAPAMPIDEAIAWRIHHLNISNDQ